MKDSKLVEDSGSERGNDQAKPKPDSDATSKDTVSDLEDGKEDAGSGSSSPDSGPSPDGAIDESPEVKDAGPM